jgi:hypothetical protein
MVPVTTDQFFGVFTAYNQTIWPAQVALILLALMAVYGPSARRAALAAQGQHFLRSSGSGWVWSTI